MEAQKPHDLDVFELTRSELNAVLSIIGKLPFEQVSGVMSVLTSRPPARAVTEEQLKAIADAVAARAEEASLALASQEVNLEAQADVSEASGPSEEEKTTEQ
jgi:hypothetical protein